MFEMQRIIEILLVMYLIKISHIDIKSKTVKIIDVIVISILSLIHFLLNEKAQIAKLFLVIGFVLVMILVSALLKQAIGYADIVILGTLSLVFSYYKIIMFLFVSFLVSGFGGIVVWINKRKVKNSTMPFLPCITISFIILLLF